MVEAVRGKDRVVITALALYFFVVIFGNLFRLGGGETGYGLSTLLLVLIVLFKVIRIPQALLGNALFVSILVLFMWAAFTTLFTSSSLLGTYMRLAMLFGYLFVAVSVYETEISEQKIKILIYSMGLGILIASLATIIDFLNIYNIPYVNENQLSTKLGDERIEQAGGFFPRRSAMAAYYALIVPLLLYFGIKSENMREKLLFIGTSGLGLVVLFLTHNRSGILGIILALLLYVLMDKSIKTSRRMAVMIYLPLVIGALAYVASIYFPQHMYVYIVKLANYLPMVAADQAAAGGEQYASSDYSRIYFLVSVLQSLQSNPIGNGFSKIYTELYGYSSPHNIITYIIWAAGVVAFLWFPYFIYQVRNNLSLKPIRNRYPGDDFMVVAITAFQVGLLSWVLNNMAHNSLATGLAWMFLGLVMNMRRKLLQTSPVIAAEEAEGQESAKGKERRILQRKRRRAS